MRRIRYDFYDPRTKTLEPCIYPTNGFGACASNSQLAHGFREIMKSRYHVNIRTIDENNKPVIVHWVPLVQRAFDLETGVIVDSDYGCVLEYTTPENTTHRFPPEPNRYYISPEALARGIDKAGLVQLVKSSKCMLLRHGTFVHRVLDRVPVKLAKDENLNIYYISESHTN